jgi:diguanylate cyclase (GGDEF)-like protein/PAS domain S-box-containing protein
MSVVVILDDQVTNRKIFSRVAASIESGVTVQAFSDPTVALAWLAENGADLIITDYKMPEMDGGEFIRRYRTLPAHAEVPVIVITVYEERSFRLKALEAGATDFLQSPVDHQEFITRARNLLKLRKQQILLAAQAAMLAQKLENSERSREQAIRESTTRLAQVIDTVPAMICATDLDGKLIFVNAFQASIAGRTTIDPTGADISVLFDAEYGQRFRALDRKVVAAGATLPSFEEEVVDAAGTKRIFLTTKSPLHDDSHDIVGVLTTSLDITDRKRAEDFVVHVAQHDVLTGLPNRIFMVDRIRREVARARRGDHCFALHIVDLDGFKSINDAYGYPVGDKYLKAIGERLRALVGDSGTVARLGGDEFGILQSDVAHGENATELAERINGELARPCLVAGHRLTLNVSVGTTIHPTDAGDVNELLQYADVAMYQAKRDGGGVCRLFAADMNTRAREAVMLDTDLRDALANDQFELFYQPQVDAKSGAVVGAEALLRWNHPTRGLLLPGEFLSRAEKNGLIISINEWVLREACRQGKAWQMAGLKPIRMAVNMSPVQFRKKSVPLLVAKVLGETDFDPACLELELVESIMMEDTAAVESDLASLQSLGVGIAIDDFGTGYSSLNYIKRFPATRLKIDQCFVRDIIADPNDRAIVRTILSLAHSLEIKVVAEGVETEEQMTLLTQEGCDELQGFHFGKPMPAEAFVATFGVRTDRSAKSMESAVSGHESRSPILSKSA